MTFTGGFTGALSPDAVATAIDAVLYERLEREAVPAYLDARNGTFFKQSTIDKLKFIWDEDSNVGGFNLTGEQEELVTDDTFIGNQKNVSMRKWTKNVPISFEAFKADQVGKRTKLGEQIGDRARLTQDKRAILDVYGDIVAGSVFTTPDGQATASNSHTTLKAVTVDNLETGAISPDNLWTANVSLGAQLSQDGELGGHNFSGIVSTLNNYKAIKEVLNSNLIANSGENNLNIFETDYGQVAIKVSAFLGSAYNAASNANTTYTIISNGHELTRKVFAGLSTDMVEPKYTTNDTWLHKSRYMENAFPGTWAGVVASNGTT